ncbi:hypothetical protein LB543_01415 [Mesorhizobium sp. ESP7-2]|uniref:hypothetical protein n=1 Tax=Mesorhizobium sp. ESP7-2 TaxID=2876622 RepID=UPI001CC92D14|nr:hypothetical protein [Mesorhizobium sp. ESP7-2]MBZ9705387.1 hypothetical protein [Mesorhizobium sp. ESP7-2]
MKIAVLLVASASAISPMAPADFLADWPRLVGQRATVTGTVYNAAEDSMLLEIPPETIRLVGPWMDREDLRYLFRNCIGADAPRSKCTMPVTGTVRSVQGRLEMYAIKFSIQR